MTKIVKGVSPVRPTASPPSSSPQAPASPHSRCSRALADRSLFLCNRRIGGVEFFSDGGVFGFQTLGSQTLGSGLASCLLRITMCSLYLNVIIEHSSVEEKKKIWRKVRAASRFFIRLP